MKISFVFFSICLFLYIATPIILCGEDEPLDVNFCDLINLAQYQNIEVRVKALYRRGFESGALYSSNCNSEHSVWLSLPSEYRDGYLPLLDLDLNSFKRQTIGIIVVGTMSGAGRYGHLNMSDYEFSAIYIEKAEILFEENFINKIDMSDDEKQKIEDDKKQIEKEWENSL